MTPKSPLPNERTTVAGGCLCGGIRYAIDEPLAPIELCHCAQCRKAQGSAFAANIPVARAAFTLVAGAELLREFESSPGKWRAFCRRCGSPILSRRAATPDRLRLRAGTLDEPVAARVAAHYCVADKAAWWTIADTLPQYPGSRAASAERLTEPGAGGDAQP